MTALVGRTSRLRTPLSLVIRASAKPTLMNLSPVSVFGLRFRILSGRTAIDLPPVLWTLAESAGRAVGAGDCHARRQWFFLRDDARHFVKLSAAKMVRAMSRQQFIEQHA